MIHTKRTIEEYMQFTEEELYKLEMDNTLPYEEYETVCIVRALKNIDKPKYTTKEVLDAIFKDHKVV